MLVQVRYGQQQKYVKLEEDEGRFDFLQFHEKEFSDSSLDSAPGLSDSSFSSSTSTVIIDEVYRKRQRIEDTRDAASAKQLIEAVLRGKSGGEEVLQEYQTTETLTDAARRRMVNILVAHMIDNHGQQKVSKEMILIRQQPTTKKWPLCCCCYISFHHLQGD
ncbi:unnamed protein product [Boreogadus saida]